MRRSRGENSLSKKTFTRVFENEFGPRERKPRKKKQSVLFAARIRPNKTNKTTNNKKTYMCWIKIFRCGMSSSLCHVRHCPPFRVASVPLDAISDYSSLYNFLFLFSVFLSVFSFKFFFVSSSSVLSWPFFSLRKFLPFRAISLDLRVFSSSTRARSEVSFRSFSLLTRQTQSSRSNTGGFNRFFTT